MGQTAALTAYNKLVSGSAHCVRLDPNPRYARTSGIRKTLAEMEGREICSKFINI